MGAIDAVCAVVRDAPGPAIRDAAQQDGYRTQIADVASQPIDVDAVQALLNIVTVFSMWDAIKRSMPTNRSDLHLPLIGYIQIYIYI